MIKEEKNNEYKNMIIILLLIFLIGFIGVTLALWSRHFIGTKQQEIITGKLELVLANESAGISLINSVPVTDEQGKTNKPYFFKIINRGSKNAIYKVYLEKDDSAYINGEHIEKPMPWENVKYFLKENQNEKIGDLTGDNKKRLIYESSINTNEEDDYLLKLWIREDATNDIADKHFHAKITVEATYDN